ncbi:ABC transporter ATP-binding protein [Pseudaminobacter arsenicus]|uniref:ABC transporter ATP-binding protein n=1 Tax=Borborobacter arsenicus TaxID=1851146 RepID=A0A432V3I3_9HYPH|nr:ABC transporter ATP-binding protein [Pseudaminobacter arsenicus]RUM96602.1 ABC transporter ATP-binding protein [Pseudaminobacter arsenicus]
MSEPALVLNKIVVAFGALKAVDDISLTVKGGERRAVIGPNGAGKTTLFNAITGVRPPTSGRITFEGKEVTGKPAQIRARMGMSRTFQITNLFPTMTVDENMQLALRGTGRGKFSMLGSIRLTSEEHDRVSSALQMSRLGERGAVAVNELSYGEQRQLEMAMALVSNPRLLLLDEPAAGLSPAERHMVADIIRSLPHDLTMVLIEHDMELVLNLVDKVTCLNNGQMLAEGSPEDISNNQLVQDVYLGKARADA